MAAAVSSGKPSRSAMSSPRAAERDEAPGGEGEAGAIVPVDELHAPLDDAVVGAEERAHAGGVARAAGVLEQQRVVERGERGVVEAELAPDAHAEEAAAHGVAGGLPFGEVERAREGAEDLGEGDVLDGRVRGREGEDGGRHAVIEDDRPRRSFPGSAKSETRRRGEEHGKAILWIL